MAPFASANSTKDPRDVRQPRFHTGPPSGRRLSSTQAVVLSRADMNWLSQTECALLTSIFGKSIGGVAIEMWALLDARSLPSPPFSS